MQSSPSSPPSQEDSSWASRVLGEHHNDQPSGFFTWWYRHTSPPEEQAISLQQHLLMNRSRVASGLLLFLLIILLFVAAIALLELNLPMLAVVAMLYPLIILCLLLNRHGQVQAVGLLLTVGLVSGMSFTLVGTAFSGGLTPGDTDLLYLLFFAEIITAALLPIQTIFLVAGVNLLISLWALFLAPHTPALDLLLSSERLAMLLRLIQIHVLVPGALWVLITIHQSTLTRANRAEELAQLQHDLALMNTEHLKQKEALEQGLALISEVHRRVANGDLDARVSLPDEDVALWQIAGPLNMLIGRYHHAKQEIRIYETFVAKMASSTKRQTANLTPPQDPS